MNEEFYGVLRSWALRCGITLEKWDFEIFQDELGNPEEYLGSLKAFIKENYSRPRLPSPKELKEAVQGKQINKNGLIDFMILSYKKEIQSTGDNREVRNRVGGKFFLLANSVMRIEQLRLTDNFAWNDFAKTLKQLLQAKSLDEIQKLELFKLTIDRMPLLNKMIEEEPLEYEKEVAYIGNDNVRSILSGVINVRN